jgi:CRP/FNR family cyclic AMP-dependent transcriptional regulator
MSADKGKIKGVWEVDVVEYSWGQFVIREGEEADCAYVIKQGEVEVLKKSPDGRDIRIAKLGSQEIFGEMCLFENSPRRSATVRVISERAVVMSISKEHFQKHLDGMPEGIRSIIQILIQRLRKANRQITILS